MAAATRVTTDRSKGSGRMRSGTGADTAAASPSAAAISIRDSICHTPLSRAPRKMPGKARTLLIWFGKSRAAGGHHEGPGLLGQFRHDLRYRIGQGKNDRVRRHGPDHRRREDPRGADADEDVRPGEGRGQVPPEAAGVGPLGQGPLAGIEVRPLPADGPLPVTDSDVRKAVFQKQPGHRRPGRPGPAHHHPDRPPAAGPSPSGR